MAKAKPTNPIELHPTRVHLPVQHSGAAAANGFVLALPTHLDLPDKDDQPVKNFQEHPQSRLLTDSIWPVLERVRPALDFCLGADCGIYYRIAQPPIRGAVAPDWFFVAGVPQYLDGRVRRSYVLWQELVVPNLALEYLSDEPGGERDRTPGTGKFWIYERAIRIPYYGIFDAEAGRVEMFRLGKGGYKPMRPNVRGRFPIPTLGVELGIWQGVFQGMDLAWMRWWGADGKLLPTSEERAAAEHQRAEQERQRATAERQRAEQERQRADRLAAKLRELGLKPEDL
jgi:Uma2 family endonuclease